MRPRDGRGADCGAVAVTLLLILVLGASSSQRGSVIGGRDGAGSIIETWAEAGKRTEVRASVTAVSPAAGTARVVIPRSAFVAPRFRRVDGHAWPPPRAPSAC